MTHQTLTPINPIKLLKTQIQFRALMSLADKEAKEVGCDRQTALRELTLVNFAYDWDDPVWKQNQRK